MVEGKKEIIGNLEKKYPKLANAKFSEIDQVILGNDRKSYNVELQKQKQQLKMYIEKCSKWHPALFYDVLDFEAKHTREIIGTHNYPDMTIVCKQSSEWASLRSCWNYFHRLFTRRESTCLEIIKSTVESVLEKDRQYRKRCLTRDVSPDIPSKMARIEPFTEERQATDLVEDKYLDLNSVIVIPPLFKEEKLAGVYDCSNITEKAHFFYSSEGRMIELRKRGVKTRFPLSIEFRKGGNHMFHPPDHNVCVGELVTGNDSKKTVEFDPEHIDPLKKQNKANTQQNKNVAVVNAIPSNPRNTTQQSGSQAPGSSIPSHFAFDSDRNVLVKKEIKVEEVRPMKLVKSQSFSRRSFPITTSMRSGMYSIVDSRRFQSYQPKTIRSYASLIDVSKK